MLYKINSNQLNDYFYIINNQLYYVYIAPDIMIYNVNLIKK